MNKTCIPKYLVDDLKKKLASGEINAGNITDLLPEEQKAVKSILEDIVSENLGASVSADELKKISEKSKVIQKAQSDLADNFGNVIDNYEEHLNFFKAKREMDDLLKELNPSSKAKVLTGTIARGSMLASPKSIALNIESNILNSVSESIGRRAELLQFKQQNTDLIKDYVKRATEIYNKTGYDISRTLNDDWSEYGKKVLGDTISAKGVKGAVGKYGRLIEDKVFKLGLGLPDTVTASANFADSATLRATKLAKGDKELSRKFAIDAMSLNPKTEEGKLIKQLAIADAEHATYTNISGLSKYSEKVRSALNDLYPNARIGDWTIPFVKTPANVIDKSLEASGTGAGKAIVELVKMAKSKNVTNEGVATAIKQLTRSGIGLSGASIIASIINEDDFVGAYDPARKQIEELRNTGNNAVRIGNKWVSLDYFGPFGAPLVGIMYAKKYGNSPAGKAIAYGKGIGSQITRVPGLEEMNNIYDYFNKKIKGQEVGDLGTDIGDSLVSNGLNRFIPSIVGDLAKITDKYERDTNVKYKGVKVGSALSKIPVARQSLPKKISILGDEIKGENALIELLAGARIKTSKETESIKKINDLVNKTGKNLSITDWNKSTSKQLQEAKNNLGEESFNKANIEYRKELKSMLEELLKSPKFNMANDLSKINQINSLDQKAMKKVLKNYGIKYE